MCVLFKEITKNNLSRYTTRHHFEIKGINEITSHYNRTKTKILFVKYISETRNIKVFNHAMIVITRIIYSKY